VHDRLPAVQENFSVDHLEGQIELRGKPSAIFKQEPAAPTHALGKLYIAGGRRPQDLADETVGQEAGVFVAGGEHDGGEFLAARAAHD
jgi:hypothetical protein